MTKIKELKADLENCLLVCMKPVNKDGVECFELSVDDLAIKLNELGYCKEKGMELTELKIPPFERFSLYNSYGKSKNCYIGGWTITRPEKFYAYCYGQKAYFEHTPDGLEEAKKWLNEQRHAVLKGIGVIGD